MKKLLLILIFNIFTLSNLFAGAVIIDFKGDPAKNKVTIKWTTMSETNCKEFEIQRSLDKVNYQRIGSVDAAGNSSERKEYSFEDNSVFKTTANTFYYRIKIINLDGTESIFSETIVVTPSVSGVQHTWGSIKALFR